jgi:ElaB/YqjD/DUF883 family membrane-anchored ribosome-binding protein
MNVEHKNNQTAKHPRAGDHDGAGADAQSILEHGEEVYGRAEEAVTDAYDKTAQAVGQTYEQVKNYSNENPGKTILITLGVGFGLGLLLGVSSRRSRTGRFAQPVVNALSDIALALFR